MIDFDFARATPIERTYHEANKVAYRAEFLAEEMRHAWLTGQTRVESVCGTEELASAISFDLCNVPGNPLHAVIAFIRKHANLGDVEANSIIDSMAQERGWAVAELEQDKGVLE